MIMTEDNRLFRYPASREEKDKYDKKKLCRSMGIMMLLIAAILSAIFIVNNDSFTQTMIFPIIIIVGIELFYSNKYCYKK
jgi:hypothetical protein